MGTLKCQGNGDGNIGGNVQGNKGACKGNFFVYMGTPLGTWEQMWELGWERGNIGGNMNLLLGLCLSAWGRLGGFRVQLGVCIWEHCVYWVILISMPNSITCIVYTAYSQY